MVDLENLRVSLTKNGYLKIARLVEAHPSNEILAHTAGALPGVNLIPSQVGNILCADRGTLVVPGFWDEIRQYDRPTIRAFTMLAIIYSHHRLIETFLGAGSGNPRGTLLRSDFDTEKEYTNLAFALSEVDACPYVRGAGEVNYDLTPVTAQLAGVGSLVAKLIRAKLVRCGWRDPDEFIAGGDLPFLEECQHQQFHRVLGLSFQRFSEWLTERPRRPR